MATLGIKPIIVSTTSLPNTTNECKALGGERSEINHRKCTLREASQVV